MKLIIPSTRQGRGGGHLKRSLRLLESLEEAKMLLLIDDNCFSKQQLMDMISLPLRSRVIWDWPENHKDISWILLDQFQTDKELLQLCRKKSQTIIALDEGGDLRMNMDYLIDSLPRLSNRGKANIYSPEFLFFEDIAELTDWNKRNSILISFGNEDPMAFSAYFIGLLTAELDINKKDITLVKGPLFKPQDIPQGINILDSPENLSELLADYKIVITSFGITAYESERSGCSVLLLNPTSYHQKLAQKAGFSTIGVGKVKGKGLDLLKKELLKLDNRIQEKEQLKSDGCHLDQWLRDFQIKTSQCPVCKVNNTVFLRVEQGNFYRCKECGNYYYRHLLKENCSYSEAYFFEDYKNQYGKTYLDDFEHIYQMGCLRLSHIEDIRAGNGVLLDLGCAFGPFLKAAEDFGHQVRGVELSSEASSWVQSNLKIPVINKSLTDPELDKELSLNPVDIITLWYVIEHFDDQQQLLSRIHRWLKPQGILAFSTPYGSGISARKNIEHFLRKSPRDHFIIYTRKGIKKVLKKFGFELVKLNNTGHHPDRIIKNISEKNLFYPLLLKLSKIFKWGDTFEIYAKRKN